MSGHAGTDREFTVDELASLAQMTVRNVRAYSTRGLIDPPRLEGRTGYYSTEHLQRLRLIRTLLARGFTLAAVEEAILNSPSTASGVALDLLNIFDDEVTDDPSEVVPRGELAALAGVPTDHPIFDRLVDLGLLEIVDDSTVRMTEPGVLRPGAIAMSLGLTPDSVVDIVPQLREHLQQIADHVVAHVSEDITQPFLDAGLPQDEWPAVLEKVDALIPIASQVVVAQFRSVLRAAIESEVGRKLEELAATAAAHESA